MALIQLLASTLLKTFSFKGRATRKEYWLFVLFNFIVFLILSAITMVAFRIHYIVGYIFCVPTAIILSPDGQKALWTNVGYTPLFLEQLQTGIQGLEKDYPDTAKAVKDEVEAEAKAKADAKAAQEKAELEAFEKQQKEAEARRRNAELNPWGAGRINRNPVQPVQRDPELMRELDKNGPIMGPDVLPNGGPAPYRPAVKRD